MARFEKEAMFDELRTILLYEADHILMGRGEEAAAVFIGFEVGEEGEHLNLDPARVDLDLFPITSTFRQGYDWAFAPSPLNRCGGDEVQDLQVFMEATPRAGGILSGGTMHAFMSPEGFCRQVAETALARWKLADHGGDLTVRELALLADMSEGAVRNAIALGGEGGLRAVKGSKPLVVDGTAALAWLKGRRAFVPTPETARDDAYLAERIGNAAKVVELVDIVREADAAADGNFLERAGATSWDEVAAGISCLDMPRIQGFGEKLGVDVPAFVGRAVELALRERLALLRL